ncbi:MAG: beta-glucosidase, partial [Lentisphaerota bacterium]
MKVFCYKDSKQPLEKRIRDLLGRMTIEEKAGQLNQLYSGNKSENLPSHFADIRAGSIGSFIWGKFPPVLRNQLQRVAVEESRLG